MSNADHQFSIINNTSESGVHLKNVRVPGNIFDKKNIMMLPNRDKAYIPPKKLHSYLLSETHPVGKSKAKFFRALGFNETNISVLEQGLLNIARTESVTEVISSLYGMKYVIDGSLTTPHGKSAKVRTVWIIEIEEENPRFVTAHPN